MLHDYRRMIERSKKMDEVNVSREEFVRLMVANGETEEKANRHANISIGLGSAVMIGDKMVKIKE